MQAEPEIGASNGISSAKTTLPWPVWLLLAYLAAVIIFGKGPTYLGIGPIYWGEVTMVALLAWMFTRMCLRGFPRILWSPLSMLILTFMLLGAVLTYFGFRRYGMDALRDAAIWYYGAFYFIGLYITSIRQLPVASCQLPETKAPQPPTPNLQPPTPVPSSSFILHPSSFRSPSYGDRLWNLLIYVWLAALAWNVLNRQTGNWLARSSPLVPGRGTPVLSGSGSENYMHLALGAILVVMGFMWKKESLIKKLAIIAVVLTAAGLLFTCQGRGVKLAVMGAVVSGFLATFNARKAIWPTGKTVALVFILVWLLGVGAILAGPEGLAASGRLTRFSEITEEAKSGTAYWRRIWWKNIADQVHRENPAFGLGFGINLGKFNPFLTADETSRFPVRSPHNFNMTVFGRMGYVGAALWAAVLLVGLGTLFVRVFRGRGPPPSTAPSGSLIDRLRAVGNVEPLRACGVLGYTVERRKELTFWLMALTATWLNASFGVLMEGPVLGIPFWFFLGFATGRSASEDGVELATDEHG